MSGFRISARGNLTVTNPTIIKPSLSGVANATGMQSARVALYQWAKVEPKLPGACVFDWSTGKVSMGGKPNGWNLMAIAKGLPGETLYLLSMGITSTAHDTLTVLDWEGAEVSPIAHEGT